MPINEAGLSQHDVYKKGTLLGQRYKVVGIKRGGMGEVLFCYDTNDNGSPVALKTYPDELHSESTKRRFLKEAEAWVSLQVGPDGYIVRLKDVTEFGAKPYLVIEYCPGGSLKERLAASPLSVREAVQVILEVACGMHWTSDIKHLVHRDLKPDNILFDAKGNAKITDLGIVRYAGDPNEAVAFVPGDLSTQTKTGAFIGTVPYAAPEQLMGSADADHRIDIWALGVVFYEMLAGERPFSGRSGNLVREIVYDTPSWQRIHSTAGKNYVEIIERCLRKNPSERYANFSEFLKAIDPLVKFPMASPRLPFYKRDKRLSLSDPKLEAYWFVLFPERKPKAELQYTVNHGAINGFSEANDFRAIGSFDNALKACDKVLGDPSDIGSNFSRFARNELTDSPQMEEREKLKYFMVPPRDFVQLAIELKFSIFVDAIEKTPDGKRYIGPMFDFCMSVLDAGIRHSSILNKCAQAFVKAEDYEEALRLLRILIEHNPKDPHNWAVMVVTLHEQGDLEAFRTFTDKELLPALQDEDDALAQRTCGKACVKLERWLDAANHFEAAYELAPESVELLSDACGSYLNAGDRQYASVLFQQLSQKFPTSVFTHRFAKVFNS